MTLEIGQLIESKYRIVRLIGEGGMGAVYEGENVRINRRVAIKVLHSGFTGNAEVIQRFEREAQAAGRIGNDHILEVLDLGSLNGEHYIVMEYLDGDPLANRIKVRGRLSTHELTPIVRQVLAGLTAAHQVGIVHRDLKPDNIFILKEKAGNRDFVKIIDFGISKFQPLSGDGMKMTRTGAVMGTPYYMSPEQASGSREADHRSDLYSMGVIMFEAITGRVPFEAGTFNQLMFKIVLSEVPTIESLVPDADPAYSTIIAKAMARDVSHRFQTAAEFIQALDDWTTRGASVSVPPAADAAAAGLVPNPRASMPSATGLERPSAAGARTAGNWASSQPDVKASRSRALAIMAGAALVVLVGGGLAAYRVVANAQAPLAASGSQLTPSAGSAPAPKPSAVAEPEIRLAPSTTEPAAPIASTLASSASAKAPTIGKPAGASRPLAAAATPARFAPSKTAKAKGAAGSAAKPNPTRAAPLDFGY